MAKRRLRGEGSVFQRADGRWVARVVDLDGRRRELYGQTAAKASEKLLEARTALKQGMGVVNLNTTTKVYLEQWLAMKKGTIRPQTWNRYRQLLTLHVIPEIGREKLGRLTSARIERMYGKLLEKMTSGSVHNVATVLTSALDHAVSVGTLGRNPAAYAKRPKVTRKAASVFGPEELKTFLGAVAGHRYEAAFQLLATSGARVSEILGVRWRQVDLTAGTVKISSRLDRLPDDYGRLPDGAEHLTGRWVLMPPKTNRSARVIPLLPSVVESLRRRQATQHVERETGAESGVWSEFDLVFTDEAGRPVCSTHLYKQQFLPVLEAAGLPRIRVHDLRHSLATMVLNDASVPAAAVTALLGHASVSTTTDVYFHLMDGLAKQAMKSVERQVFGDKVSDKVSNEAPHSRATSASRSIN